MNIRNDSREHAVVRSESSSTFVTVYSYAPRRAMTHTQRHRSAAWYRRLHLSQLESSDAPAEQSIIIDRLHCILYTTRCTV